MSSAKGARGSRGSASKKHKPQSSGDIAAETADAADAAGVAVDTTSKGSSLASARNGGGGGGAAAGENKAKASRGFSALRRPVMFVLFVVFLDMAAVGLVVPLLTRMTRDLGASPTTVGAISSVYGWLQLVSSPVAGHWSDRYGRRILLVGCLAGTGVAYLITGSATTLWVLVAGRALAGVVKQTMGVTKAYMADLTTPEERTRAMSFFYMFTSLGFMVGPALGGMLSRVNQFLPFGLSAALYIANAILVAMFAPGGAGAGAKEGAAATGEGSRSLSDGKVASASSSSNNSNNSSNSSSSSKEPKGAADDTQQHSMLALIKSLNPLVRRLLVLRLMTGLAVMLMRSALILVIEYRFESFDAQQKGFLMSFFALVGVVSQGFIIPAAAQRISEQQSVVIGSAVLAGAYLLFCASHTMPAIFASVAVMAVSSSLIKTVMTGLFTKASDPDKLGGVMGLVGSSFSACRAMAPLVGGWLIENTGTLSPLYIGASLLAATSGLAAISNFEQQPPQQEKKMKEE